MAPKAPGLPAAGGVHLWPGDITARQRKTVQTHWPSVPGQCASWWRVTGNNFAGTHKTLAPGFSADFETTRIYLSGSAHLYRAPGLTHDYASVRAGFSL